MEALAEEQAALQAFWVLHRPCGLAQPALALRLLHAVAASPAAAWVAAAQAGALFAAATLLPVRRPYQPAQQVGGHLGVVRGTKVVNPAAATAVAAAGPAGVLVADVAACCG